MRAGAAGAVGRAAVLVSAAFAGAIAGVDASDIGAAHYVEEKMRAAGELEGARDYQESGDLNEAPQPQRERARRGGHAVSR